MVRTVSEEYDKIKDRFKRYKMINDEIVNNILSGLLVLNNEMEILYCNEQFLTLFGLNSRCIIEQPFLHVMEQCKYAKETGFSDFYDRFVKKVKDHSQSALLKIGENESECYFSLLVKPFDLLQDAVLVDIRDYTQQWHREQEVIKRERLATLGSMLLGLAHEINNPNAANKVNAKNLEMMMKLIKEYALEGMRNSGRAKIGSLDSSVFFDKALQACSDIQFASEKISEIVGTLKSHGSVNAEQFKDISAETLVHDAVRLCKQELQKVKFSFIPPKPELFIRGNKTQLTQVLINLFVNSVHAIECQYGEDSLKNGMINVLIHQNPDHSSLEIQVLDNGCGIKQEDISKLFNGDYSTKSDVNGMGLGLWISQRIVSLHKGSIAVSSQIGQGTTFTVELPSRNVN